MITIHTYSDGAVLSYETPQTLADPSWRLNGEPADVMAWLTPVDVNGTAISGRINGRYALTPDMQAKARAIDAAAPRTSRSQDEIDADAYDRRKEAFFADHSDAGVVGRRSDDDADWWRYGQDK